VQLGHGGSSHGLRVVFLLVESGTFQYYMGQVRQLYGKTGIASDRQRWTQRSRSGLQSAQNIGAALK